MKNRPTSKKIWLINRDFQLKYAGAGLAAGIASTVITATLIIYPLFVFKILTIGMFLPWPIFACIAAALILNCIIQMVFGIVMTHKIAGPMFSLIKHLRLVGVGQWKVIMHQRKGDELHMIVRHFNEMSENIVKFVESDLNELEVLKSEISNVYTSKNFSSESQAKLMKAVEELEENLRQRVSQQKDKKQ